MSKILAFYRSPVGKKAVMAATGFLLFGFVFVHMAGNLKLYQGAEAMNKYAEFLRDFGKPVLPREGVLWVARVALLAAAGLHILSAAQLTLLARRARPQDYERRARIKATYASRTMRWGGVIVLAFILYHLAHFTFGPAWAHPDFVHGDVYHNVVAGFSVWWVAAFYVVAQVLLGLHLYHGLWSMFQSLGWYVADDPNDWRRRFAQVFAVVIAVVNISFPVAVLTGIVGG
ncbi:MAG: succinate dehydrogenase cytochrome b subunit [Thermoanaerobaculia bacterium]|nr:succinate dehydrogenase cytochrome b subunit [Thermoanaerobaculia bacterium]